MCLNAGAMGRQDAESETLIPINRCDFDVAHTLRGDGFDASEDGSGRGTPLVPVAIQAGALRENPNSGPDGVGVQSDLAYTIEARAEVQAVAFAQNQRDEVRQMDIAGALAAEPGMKQQTYVATEPFTLAERGRAGGANLEYRQDGTSNTILTPSGGRGGIGVGAIATTWQVRRLTVKECERLQGFPDGFTLIETAKRRTVEPDMGVYLADAGAIVVTGNDGRVRTNAAADGNRYKALGNSWAVPVGRWIIGRLADCISQLPDQTQHHPSTADRMQPALASGEPSRDQKGS